MNSKTLFSVNRFYLLITSLLLSTAHIFACTIVSAVDSNGQVWNMNNEDGPFGVANFINVFPKSDNTKYGYYTLSYFSPELGHGGGMQGGANEAGLTFDFNAINRIENVDLKEAFPPGDNAILPHILSTMSSVEEVIAFFNTYWFQNGFYKAQMHVADKHGSFAIISASGTKLIEKGRALVSTNFDICGNEGSASCWRYPIAISKLSEFEVNFDLMKSIALETAQKNGATMYTNIQNLSTGEVWFFSKHDPGKLVRTSIRSLLNNGKKSYSFNDLEALKEKRPDYEPKVLSYRNISDSLKQKLIGNYHNSYTGIIKVNSHPKGLSFSFADGRTEVFYSNNEKIFFHPGADVIIKFSYDELVQKPALMVYENGFWSLTAWERIKNDPAE